MDFLDDVFSFLGMLVQVCVGFVAITGTGLLMMAGVAWAFSPSAPAASAAVESLPTMSLQQGGLYAIEVSTDGQRTWSRAGVRVPISAGTYVRLVRIQP